MNSPVLRRSPMFYVGDKYKLITEIKKYFPTDINTFIEPFVGGGSVFLNTDAKKYLLNDIDENVINLHNYFNNIDINSFLASVIKIAKKYNLSRSFIEDVVPLELKKANVKTYYAKFNKNGYNKLRSDFNKSKNNDQFMLYILLIYGFNRMLRFNSKGEFNIPVGNVDFNQNVEKALKDYLNFVKGRAIRFENLDFRIFMDKIKLNKHDFIYLDPPYLITFSEYNKIWNEKREVELLNLLDKINSKNIKFAISNVTKYKGKTNELFVEWMKKYNSKKIKSNYISYYDNSIKEFEEVLVFNY